MITTTIISSSSVKPFCDFSLMACPLFFRASQVVHHFIPRRAAPHRYETVQLRRGRSSAVASDHTGDDDLAATQQRDRTGSAERRRIGDKLSDDGVALTARLRCRRGA